MRYIDFSIIDTNDPDVRVWLAKAKRCLGNLSAKTTHAERVKFLARTNIWSEFKPIFVKYYGDKCWYSECSLEGEFGDIDHFRPKSKSTDEEGNIILEDGYWWLAYDYFNYRLSCEKSNRSFGNGGKNDKFPLKEGSTPAIVGEKDDIPLLLDPCVYDDVVLVDCNETGEIVALSNEPYEILRVEVSKKIYNWNCFNNSRKIIRSKCKTVLEVFDMLYEASPHKIGASISQIFELVDPKTPYSSFAKRYIEFKIQGKPYEDIITKAIESRQ